MTSFIELPRMHLDGRDNGSLYVNVDTIVTFHQEYSGQTRVDIRGYGTDGMIGSIQTYAPIAAIIRALELLAEHPTVYSWSTSTKSSWSVPLSAELKVAHAKERAAR